MIAKLIVAFSLIWVATAQAKLSLFREVRYATGKVVLEPATLKFNADGSAAVTSMSGTDRFDKFAAEELRRTQTEARVGDLYAGQTSNQDRLLRLGKAKQLVVVPRSPGKADIFLESDSRRYVQTKGNDGVMGTAVRDEAVRVFIHDSEMSPEAKRKSTVLFRADDAYFAFGHQPRLWTIHNSEDPKENIHIRVAGSPQLGAGSVLVTESDLERVSEGNSTHLPAYRYDPLAVEYGSIGTTVKFQSPTDRSEVTPFETRKTAAMPAKEASSLPAEFLPNRKAFDYEIPESLREERSNLLEYVAFKVEKPNGTLEQFQKSRTYPSASEVGEPARFRPSDEIVPHMNIQFKKNTKLIRRENGELILRFETDNKKMRDLALPSNIQRDFQFLSKCPPGTCWLNSGHSMDLYGSRVSIVLDPLKSEVKELRLDFLPGSSWERYLPEDMGSRPQVGGYVRPMDEVRTFLERRVTLAEQPIEVDVTHGEGKTSGVLIPSTKRRDSAVLVYYSNPGGPQIQKSVLLEGDALLPYLERDRAQTKALQINVKNDGEAWVREPGQKKAIVASELLESYSVHRPRNGAIQIADANHVWFGSEQMPERFTQDGSTVSELCRKQGYGKLVLQPVSPN